MSYLKCGVHTSLHLFLHQWSNSPLCHPSYTCSSMETGSRNLLISGTEFQDKLVGGARKMPGGLRNPREMVLPLPNQCCDRAKCFSSLNHSSSQANWAGDSKISWCEGLRRRGDVWGSNPGIYLIVKCCFHGTHLAVSCSAPFLTSFCHGDLSFFLSHSVEMGQGCIWEELYQLDL